jgi:hypothetical protein
MCGEVEDDKQFDNEITARFLYIASGHGVTPETIEKRAAAPLSGDAERSAYMSELFRQALNQAASDLCAIPEGERAETLANQAIVFARLAGFLAGQLPQGDDMTRALIEAMLDGQDEPKRTFAQLQDRDHGHSHDHDHDHDHHHDGHHHHHH